jgi:hypothetical protein
VISDPLIPDHHREDNPLAPKHETKSAEPCDGLLNHIQDTSHTFIARFWLEPREIKGAKPIWRGVVEHVASGRRLYLEDLDEIKTFIANYLQERGIWP